MGKNIENKQINQKICTNVRRQYCVEMVGGKYDRELNQLLCDILMTDSSYTTARTRTQPAIVWRVTDSSNMTARRRRTRRAWVEKKTRAQRSEIIVHKCCNQNKLLKLHECTMKNETEQKRGHLVRKMTLEKKETANSAHGGVRHKKRHKQAKRGTKRPICRRHAHRVRRVTHRSPPGPISLCSVVCGNEWMWHPQLYGGIRHFLIPFIQLLTLTS
jgi:hypothetical protein